MQRHIQARRASRGRGESAIHNGVVATVAGQHEIFVERRLHDSRIGEAQYGICGFYVVRDAQPRLRLAVVRYTVVDITSNTQIEGPIVLRNRVLGVQSQFLHVRVAVE
jgi:hypothetical protein